MMNRGRNFEKSPGLGDSVRCFQQRRMEEKQAQLAAEEQRIKAELRQNLQLKTDWSSDIQTKKLRDAQLSDKVQSENAMIEERRKLFEETKEILTKTEDRRLSVLDDLDEEVRLLALKFTSAPQNFGFEKITADIEALTAELSESHTEMKNEIDPKIKESERLIQEEPVTLVEMSGSPVQGLLAMDLEILINKLEESKEKLKKLKQEQMRRKEELSRYEASCN